METDIRTQDYDAIHFMLDGHKDIAYWDRSKRQELCHLMLQALDGEPTGDTVTIDQQAWLRLASDMSHAGDAISPATCLQQLEECKVKECAQ